MSTLLYNSATDIKVERDYLANLQTPEPLGKHHAPYPFHAFTTDTADAIERAGFTIEQEDFAITKDENRFFGLFNVSRPVAPDAPTFGIPALHRPKWGMLVALRGAHDQSISRKLEQQADHEHCASHPRHGRGRRRWFR